GSIRRKKRQPAQPLTAATANSNATTAAAAAFGRRDSISSLSSAAAAAALRARPTTPTNVADVQTRRMRRRSVSVSSYNSHPDTRPADLHRSPSQSSMSGRTFRSPSPSPHRAPTPATPADPDAPPVPAIPDDMRTDPHAAAGGRRKRQSTNLHTQPFRVASERENDEMGGGSWFGAATEGDLTNVRRTALPALQTQQQQPTADVRSGAVSPSSLINFSYPRGSQVGTPPASPVAERTPSVTRSQPSVSPRRADSVASRQSSSSAIPDQALVYDPNSRRMVPRPDLLAREMSVRAASEKPVKRNKSHSSLPRSGSHFSRGTVARTSGTLVENPTAPSKQPATSLSAEAQSPSRPHALTTANGHVSVSAPKVPPGEHGMNGEIRPQDTHANRVPSMPSPTPTTPSRLNSTSRKLEPESLTHPTERNGVSGPVSGREPTTSRGHLEEKEIGEGQVRGPSQSAPTGTISASEAVDAVPVKAASSPLARVASVDRRGARPASISPVRSARFSLTNDHLVVRHEPPPRSMSPRKSAMKNSTSPSRGASPSDEGSEMSADPANRFDDQSLSRKKSVRVSFDDENTKPMGERDSETRADSPVPRSPLPPNRRSWYDTIGSKTRPRDASGPWLDDDEIMKPRPALPSFGSVREKKPRETEEERPLVRPHALSSPGSGLTATLHPPSDDENDEVDQTMGQSSDHNIGSVLHQGQMQTGETNMSKFQEPLPPVVTSLEGSGYYSASSTDGEDEFDSESLDESEPGFDLHAAQEPALEPIQEVPHESVPTSLPEKDKKDADAPTEPAPPSVANGGHEDRHKSHRSNIPSIAITEPSPRVVDTPNGDETQQRKPAYFELPGAFPVDDAPKTSSTNANAATKAPNGVHPRPHISFPATTEEDGSDSNSDSDSSDSAIYSDAYEDLSDIDEGGFMSLDAIVTTPVSSDKVSRQLFVDAPAVQSPSNKEVPKDEKASESGRLSKSPEPSSPAPEQSKRPTADEDWEKAKAYWRSLSSEKRRQLEQEALREAAASQADQNAVDRMRTEKEREQRPASGVQQQQHTERKQDALDPQRVYQIAPGTQVPDSPDEPPPHMRKTLRAAKSQTEAMGGRAGGLRSSMRSDAEVKKSATVKSQRPTSLPQAPVSRDTSIKHKRQVSLGSPASSAAIAAGTGTAAVRPSLQRRGSDSSESSFKRARPQRQSVGFRRSMRMASPDGAGDTQRGSRFSLRSVSPPASPPPPISGGGHRMSMRSTLRSDTSEDSAHRMRVPTFGRRSGKKAAEKRKKSRFDDDSSDGEDVVGPSTAFRSRFDDDSSDEEEVPARASGTMPKSLRQRASTSRVAQEGRRTPISQGVNGKGTADEDLHSSDDDEDTVVPRRTASGRTFRSQTDRHALRHKRSGRGELAVGVVPASPPAGAQGTRHRGGGFFSVLRRRRDGLSGKVSRPELRESAARQDTKLERSAEEISSLRNGHGGSLRLQKNRAANWPLLDDVEEEKKRPATAGAAVPATRLPPSASATDAGAPAKESPRSIFSKRRSASHGLLGLGMGHHHHGAQSPREQDTGTPDLDEQSQADGSVRRKKFGKLRKMFGLND
ncbi:hypothetical protein ACRALDRAFT_1061105, partial [Sodiomyces alcalophilus JCM 7366]|uniref:uncharacterized protein n=1 Tax=Sodiomyces alcalophilus JCM 7366 TaxID=591952 RepID=UPI0039B4C880